MLTLHICTNKEKENETRLNVANIIEARVRKQLEYRDNIFTTFAVTIARQKVNLEINNKDDFDILLKRVLGSQESYDYYCPNIKMCRFIISKLKNNYSDLRDISVVINDIKYMICDISEEMLYSNQEA